MIKVTDLMVADTIMQIVEEEVKKIQQQEVRDAAELGKLERLTKTYALLMASARENLKQQIYGKLSLEDLEQLDKSSHDANDSSNESTDL